MRCETLIRELASPTGALSPVEMASHLAQCPSCAEWSRQARRFDQIWEATRPTEPSPAMIDALWASASVALESRSATSPLRLEGLTTTRRSWIKPAIFLVQAAAILLAAGIFWTRPGPVEPVQLVQNDSPVPNPVAIPLAPPAAVVTSPAVNYHEVLKSGIVVANVDETLMVSIPDDPKVAKVARLKEKQLEESASTPFELMGAVEAMAENVVVTSR